MPVTQADIADFSSFASAQISNGGADLSMADLLASWSAARERDAVNAAIRAGLQAIDDGRTRPIEESMEDFRQQHNLPSYE